MIDKSDLMKFHKSSIARQQELALAESAKKEQLKEQNRAFYSKYYDSLNERARIEAENESMMSNARNSALSTCLKAIYITALDPNTLSDEARLYAENLVDNYISEKGGAEKIFNETADRSYLLSRLSMIVEDSAKEETDQIKKIDVESLGDDVEATDEDKDDDKEDEEALDSASGKTEDEEDKDIDKELDDAQKDEEKAEEDIEDEEKSDDDEDEDSEDDSDDEDEDDEEDEDKNEHLRQAGSTDEDMEDVESDDDIDSKLDDSKPEEDKEDDVEGKGENIDDKLDSKDEAPEEESGAEEEDVVIDNDEDSGSKDASISDTDEDGETSKNLYDELENEEDVQKAVELIKTRVADAEEAFIKRNAEDKEKMDDLLNKISDNVKTVEKIADNDSTKSKIAKENVQLAHKEISKIHDKPQSIFEAMVRNFSSSIIKDDEVKDKYLNENGTLNVSSVMETAKVAYAFLETLNTLQLERVDGEYIKKALEQI